MGLVVDWDCDIADVYDGSAFQHLVDVGADEMVVLATCPKFGFTTLNMISD